MYKAGIAGATGYTGFELIQFIHRHPQLQIGWVTSENSAGSPVGDIHATPWDYPLIPLQEGMQRAIEVDVVFLCLPHAASIEPVRAFQETGVRVIDLSADFRLNDPGVYTRWYGIPHSAPDLLDSFVYGLCEVYRQEIQDAHLIANPGCYPTSVNLALYPLAKAGWLEERIIVDSKSGVSGAGRQSKTQYSYVEVNENLTPYNIGYRHRHIAEMEQVLNGATNGARHTGRSSESNGAQTVANQTGMYQFLFSPHLLPVSRGILSTIYLRVVEGVSEQDIRDLYRETYAGEPFIHLLPAGQTASLRHVNHTNRCAISLTPADPTRPDAQDYIFVSTLDNLVKGASGQAIQNFNIAAGLDETMGLL